MKIYYRFYKPVRTSNCYRICAPPNDSDKHLQMRATFHMSAGETSGCVHMHLITHELRACIRAPTERPTIPTQPAFAKARTLSKHYIQHPCQNILRLDFAAEGLARASRPLQVLGLDIHGGTEQ